MRSCAVIALSAASLLLVGCDRIEDQWLSWRYANTSYLVSHCVSRNAEAAKNIGLDVRNHCARKHDTFVSSEWVGTATGSFACFRYPPDPNAMATAFVLNVRNNGAYVLTRIEALFNFKSDPSTFHMTERTDVWLEPGKQADITVQLFKPVSCREVNNEQNPSKWTWELWARGVKAEVR